MDVGAFVVHVGNPVRRRVVLDARPRLLAAAPVRLAARMGLAGLGLAEDAAVELGRDPVIMLVGGAVLAVPDRYPIGRQLGEPRPEVRVDIALQHLGGGQDMRVGIINAQSVFH